MRNLDEADLQSKMACSIKGEGMARPGKINGQSVSIVERIDKITAVDWVTEAGRGGKVIALAESEDGESSMTNKEVEEVVVDEDETSTEEVSEQMTVEVRLEEDNAEAIPVLAAAVVMAKVLDADLPSRTLMMQLVSETYADEAALDAAIANARALIAEVQESLTPAPEQSGDNGPQAFGITKALPVQVGEASKASVESASSSEARIAEAEKDILVRNHLLPGGRE